MAELLHTLLQMLRRIAPSWDSLKRIYLGTKQHPIMTAAFLLFALIPGFTFLAVGGAIGLGMPLLMFFALLGLRFNGVFDAARVKTTFPGATSVLEIGTYKNWRADMFARRPPGEVHVLAERLVAEYRAGRRSVAVVSASPGEGKTTLILMLASALAGRIPMKLVDADTRQQLLKLASTLAPDATGAPAAAMVAPLEFSGAGPAAQLGLQRQLQGAAQAGELVLIDLTPIAMMRSELAALKSVDIVLLVIQQVHFRTWFNVALSRLEFLGVTPDIVVVNKASVPDPGLYYA